MPVRPSDLIKRWLIAEDHGVDPATSSGAWPIYQHFMPDGTGVQDSAICVYNTLGALDGRYMKNPKTIDHPGVMIHVRGLRGSGTDEIAFNKAKAIFDDLDSLLRWTIVISGTEYVVQIFNKTSDLIPLGVEGDVQRRARYSMNGVIDWGK